MPETGPTLGALLQTALAKFGPEARLDLELLLGEVLGLNRAGLIRERLMRVTADQQARFQQLLLGWREGRPVAQLLGRREFWSLDLTIDEHVLVPRPDTELLVETGLALLAEAPDGAVVDLGTGSGAVAIALASELGGRPVIAVERSAAALRVAAHNITGHANQRVLLVQGRWLEALAPACAALIVSNPPYLEDADPGLRADGALRFEPRQALAAGPEGLDDLAAIARAAPAHLQPGGWLALEHGATQGSAVRELLRAAGFDVITTLRDLAGNERVTQGRHLAGLQPPKASDILR
jgi:release factor glutamine methyltransferase